MIIYRRYHALSHVAVLLGVFTFCVADGRRGLALLVSVVVAGSWALFRDTVVSPLPRWAINLLLLGATANMFRSVFLSGLSLQENAITILAQYLIYLQLIKLYESRTPRDQAQLLVLNVMLVIGAVLTSVTLQVGAMLLLYAPVFLATVLLYQLYAGQHASLAPRNKPAPGMLDLVAQTGRRVTRDLRRVTALALLLISAVTFVVFLIMPRNIGDEMISPWPQASAGASSGFSDHVQLGVSGLISESRDIVLEFDLYIGGQRSDLTEKSRRLRGTVLDEYDPATSTWRRSERLHELDNHQRSLMRSQQRGFERLRRPLFPIRALEQRVRIRNKDTDHLFALWQPFQIAYEKQVYIYLNPKDSTLRMPTGRRAGYVEYRVRSYESTPFDADPPSADVRPDARSRPGVFAGTIIEEQARAIMREADIDRDPDRRNDQRILQLFERHLRDDFTYTLDLLPPPADAEPLEYFLTQSKSGHCEYFASAMAAMAQSVGIDARVVTGYVTNELDPASGSYIVRKRHAHAWVEARIRVATDDPTDAVVDPVYRPVWSTFDPTPPSELHARNTPGSGIVAWAQRTLDRVEQIWIRSVVAFGSDQQKTVLAKTGISPLQIDRLAQRLTSIPRLSIGRALQFVATTAVAFVLLAGLMLFGSTLLRWTWRRAARALRRWRLARTDPPAVRRLQQIDLYERMLRLLDKAGIPKPNALPPVAFARTLHTERPEAAARIEQFANLYYAVRFGNASLTPERLHDAEAALADLRTVLRARPTRSP